MHEISASWVAGPELFSPSLKVHAGNCHRLTTQVVVTDLVGRSCAISSKYRNIWYTLLDTPLEISFQLSGLASLRADGRLGEFALLSIARGGKDSLHCCHTSRIVLLTVYFGTHRRCSLQERELSRQRQAFLHCDCGCVVYQPIMHKRPKR